MTRRTCVDDHFDGETLHAVVVVIAPCLSAFWNDGLSGCERKYVEADLVGP